MAIPLKNLEVGKVYAYGDEGTQLFCYFGKVRAKWHRWKPEVKEGHCFVYVGREWEYGEGSVWESLWSPDVLVRKCQAMLNFELGDCFSVVKGNKPMQSVFRPDVKLDQETVLYLQRQYGIRSAS